MANHADFNQSIRLTKAGNKWEGEKESERGWKEMGGKGREKKWEGKEIEKEVRKSEEGSPVERQTQQREVISRLSVLSRGNEPEEKSAEVSQ